MSTLSSPKLGSGSINVECFLLICEAITQRMPDPNRRVAMGGRPLNDIRAASQVCRRWREILLASSWIWGRVVDLDIQHRLELLSKPQPRHGRRRADWMEEVVRRAGSSSLWIFGDVVRSETFDKEVEKDGRFDTLLFLTRLLSNSWERVEILSIRVPDQGISEISLRALFCSPAPILKHFEVIWQDRESLGTREWTSSQKLFADHAPMLRTMNADSLPFDLHAPWLSGIHEMIPIPNWLTNINDVFVLLQQMPMLLKTLIQHGFSASVFAGRIPSVHLPILTSIDIGGNLPDIARIMEHLSPGKLSCFTLVMFPHHRALRDWASPDIIPAFKKCLTDYISKLFSGTNPSTNIWLSATRQYFSFYGYGIMNDSDTGQNLRVQIPIEDRMWFKMNADDVEPIMVSVLDAITGASSILAAGGNHGPYLYESVTEITLEFAAAPPTLFAHLRSTFDAFHRIRSIIIDKSSGRNLLSVCFPDQATSSGDYGGRSDVVLFPELHRLSVIALESEYNPTNMSSDLEVFIDFLLERKKIGYPLARFDFTTFSQSECALDLGRLEEIDGLEVEWKQSRAWFTPKSPDIEMWPDIWRDVWANRDPRVTCNYAWHNME